MTRERSHSRQTVLVLRAFGDDPPAWRYGYELCQATGLKAGSMYPILMRLADRRLLETAWEKAPSGGRPARHLYRLTRAGAAEAALAAKGQRMRLAKAHLRPAAESA